MASWTNAEEHPAVSGSGLASDPESQCGEARATLRKFILSVCFLFAALSQPYTSVPGDLFTQGDSDMGPCE